MFRAFNTAVSGLNANQLKMEVIGNNIANVNTTGYKTNRATFEEMFSQNLQGATEPNGARGGTNPKQVGLGTRAVSIDTIFTQGAIQSTGRNTDVAMQGNGFFIVDDHQGAQYYTRDGNFSLDADRRLVTNTGLLVQGYTADQDGIVNTNGPLGDISIEANRTYPPKATTQVNVSGNVYRPPRLEADEAFASIQQGRIDSSQAITGNGDGAGLLELGATNNNTLEAGELTINDISIIGDIPIDPATDTSLTVMQKITDLINFYRDETGVVATVKTSPPSATPEAQIVLSALKPGTNEQIVVGGSDLADITLNGAALFNAGTTTIETLATNALGQATAGSISLISGDILINGVDIGSLAATSTTNTEEQNAQAIIGLINSKTDTTGVTAFTDGNGRISFRAIARDIILSGQTVADGTAPGDPTPGGGANVSGLFTGLNQAKTATMLAGTSTNVFDALGDQHTVGLDYIADYDVVRDANDIVIGTRDTGVWNWAATSSEPDVAVLSTNGDGAAPNTPPRTVTFDDTGLLQSFSGRFTLNFLNTDAITANSIFSFNTPLSPNINHPQPMTVDVGTVNDTNGMTQFAGSQTLSVASQDGYAAGNLSSFSIAGDGTIRGLFSNGQLLALGQLAVATFVNPEGLVRGLQNSSQGGNVWQASPNSGEVRIGLAQAGGNGSIVAGALESSNVDLADQFTEMITTQRAFQANSRTITTADEMLQEVLSLRR